MSAPLKGTWKVSELSHVDSVCRAVFRLHCKARSFLRRPRDACVSCSVQSLRARVHACRYTASIKAINERMKAYALLHKHVHFVDCGEVFLEKGDKVCSFLFTLSLCCHKCCPHMHACTGPGLTSSQTHVCGRNADCQVLAQLLCSATNACTDI